MYKYIIAALSAIAMLGGITATASASSHAPNERCKPLDKAERTLQRKGFHIVEHGGGFFGIVIKADWVVVHQSQKGNTVHLTAGRSC